MILRSGHTQANPDLYSVISKMKFCRKFTLLGAVETKSDNFSCRTNKIPKNYWSLSVWRFILHWGGTNLSRFSTKKLFLQFLLMKRTQSSCGVLKKSFSKHPGKASFTQQAVIVHSLLWWNFVFQTAVFLIPLLVINSEGWFFLLYEFMTRKLSFSIDKSLRNCHGR